MVLPDVTGDEVRDPRSLWIRLWVNPVLKQNFNTSDMTHKIPRCIERDSSIHPLEPGDVLATGTNHRGLSAFQDGDQIELETDGLGRLCLHVRENRSARGPGRRGSTGRRRSSKVPRPN